MIELIALRRFLVRPTAYVNGRVYTVDARSRWAEALLVTDGRITTVGSSDEIRAAAPADAESMDLRGGMVMPGLHDAHTHMLLSGLKFHYEQRLTPNAGAEQIVQDLTAGCCTGHGSALPDGWIIGGEFNPLALGDDRPDRAWLDEAFPDRPVYLFDYSIHHALVNTRALELAGLTAETPHPPGGRFVRRPDSGELTGELIEQATWPVNRVMPDYSADIYRAAMAWAVKVCNSVGITSVQEASTGPQVLGALAALESTDELTLQVATHIVWREETAGKASVAELDKLSEQRAEHASRHVRTDFVKLWLDGAPLPPHFTDAGLTEDGEVAGQNLLVPAR